MFGIRVQGGFTICISCSHTGIISASEVIAVRVCIVSIRSLVMALSKKRKFSGVPDVEEAPYQPKDYKFPKRSFGKNAQTTGTTFLHNSSERYFMILLIKKVEKEFLGVRQEILNRNVS